MPVNQGVISTYTIQDTINYCRAYAELRPTLSASGWERSPGLEIANDIMQKIFAKGMNWKFNRALVPQFLTVSIQQDYCTSVTDLSWLEQAWRQDINNSANPQPVWTSETIRDSVKTSFQAQPFQISWIPNRLAIMGTWKALTSYPTGSGVSQTPASPIQQFIDANGNILYVTTNGISGAVQPVLGVNATYGGTVTDGTVVWTVADPNGAAMRLTPLPSFSGLVWQMSIYYQKKPPKLTSLQQTWSPIPDEYSYIYRDGFVAKCMIHAGVKEARDQYAMWEESLLTAVYSGDRERDETGFFPSNPATGGSPFGFGIQVGPAFPYSQYGW